MTLEELQAKWLEDCSLDQLKLSQEAARTPKMHAHWYPLLVRELFLLETKETKLQELERDFGLYYNKRLPEPAVIGKTGPLNVILGSQKEKDLHIETEPVMIRAKQEYTIQKLKVDFIKDILDQIKQRTWLIKNMIDWRKFEEGG